MAFAEEMINAKRELENKGHVVIVPEFAEVYVTDPKWRRKAERAGTMIGAQRKIDHDLIRKHYNEIKDSDAILVINKNKNGVKNYIGGNTFLEMGFAYVLGKKVFVLNPLPKELKLIYQELVAMQPTVLNGKMEGIEEKIKLKR